MGCSADEKCFWAGGFQGLVLRVPCCIILKAPRLPEEQCRGRVGMGTRWRFLSFLCTQNGTQFCLPCPQMASPVAGCCVLHHHRNTYESLLFAKQWPREHLSERMKGVGHLWEPRGSDWLCLRLFKKATAPHQPLEHIISQPRF